MKNISEIRRDNLNKIIDRQGSKSKAAEKIGMTVAHLSHISAPSNYRNIGNNTARKIERVFGLKMNSLDHE